MQRIWIVSEIYYPSEISTGYLLTRIAAGLAGDFAVGAITTRDPRGSADRHDGVTIHRSGRPVRKGRLWQRVLDTLTVPLNLGWATWRNVRRGDLVFAVTNPPSLPYAVWLSAKIRRAKPVLIVHDIYPEILSVAGLIGEKRLLYRFMRWVSHSLTARFDAVITLGAGMTQRLAHCHPIYTIPNWSDLQEVRPEPQRGLEFRRQHDLNDKWVILFAGHMGYTHDLNVLRAAAQSMQSSAKPIQFVVIGDGPARPTLSTDPSPNMTLLPAMPRDRQADFLNAADIALLPMKAGMWGLSVPSRIYNIFAAGKPLLCLTEEASEVAQLIRQHQIGWVLPPGDEQALVDKIQEIYRNRHELEAMGERARKTAETHFDFESTCRAYHRVVAQLKRGRP